MAREDLNARTTPAVRAEIARSTEPSGVLARRYGVSTETIRKWHKRGPDDCRDYSARPHKLPWKASADERHVVCDLRRFTGLPLDELTFVVRRFLPHLDRDNIYRILKAEGLGRLPPRPGKRKGTGQFRTYDLGFVHMDVKHLPKLQTANGERRKRFLYVAVDRCSRSVHLAVQDEECEAATTAFLREGVVSMPIVMWSIRILGAGGMRIKGVMGRWRGCLNLPGVSDLGLQVASSPDPDRARRGQRYGRR